MDKGRIVHYVFRGTCQPGIVVRLFKDENENEPEGLVALQVFEERGGIFYVARAEQGMDDLQWHFYDAHKEAAAPKRVR